MNEWSKKSVDLLNHGNYLDKLYDIYPVQENQPRDININLWNEIKENYNNKKSKELFKSLLKLEKFPVEDSYIATIRKSNIYIENNPNCVNRIISKIYNMSLDELLRECQKPKASSRQMGPQFKNWIDTNPFNIPICHSIAEFNRTKSNAVLNVSDNEMKTFANTNLGYKRNKGLDFIAKYNNKYVLGEAKFLTDNGGTQNNQFLDAISTIDSISNNSSIITIGILDGILYTGGNTKMYNFLEENPDKIILSALLLKEFLESI